MYRRSMLTRVVLLLVVALGHVALTGCVSDRQVVAQADQLNTGLQPAIMNDPELSNYLQTVGERIITAARTASAEGYGPDSHKKEDASWMFSDKMQFHLVNSKTLNAFTTGGEHMYIYNQLFQTAKTEDELSAVMAHEFAHVYDRHVAKGMNRQYAMLGVAGAAGAAGYAAGGKEKGMDYASMAAAATLAASQFIGMGFTRKDESEADKHGFHFYCLAGWDPNQFSNFFQTMIDMGHDTTPELASDHPTLRSRVEAAKKWAAQLPPQAARWRRPPVADAAQFRRLQQRAAQLGQTMPDDQSLAKAQQLLNAFPSCVAPVDTPTQKKAQQEVAAESARLREQQPNEPQKKK